jgi:hypothetical protein
VFDHQLAYIEMTTQLLKTKKLLLAPGSDANCMPLETVHMVTLGD